MNTDYIIWTLIFYFYISTYHLHGRKLLKAVNVLIVFNFFFNLLQCHSHIVRPNISGYQVTVGV